MTREECLAYRQRCPYDAMGDFSVFYFKNSIDFSVSFYNYHEPSIYPCL